MMLLARVMFSEDYDPAKSDLATLQWSKRDLAIGKLHEALRRGVLTGFVRDPDTGEFFRLSGIDWHGLKLWEHTIISGVVRVWPGDRLDRHEGRRVLLSEAEFADWLKAFKTVIPSSVASLQTPSAPEQSLSPAGSGVGGLTTDDGTTPDQSCGSATAPQAEPPPLAAPAETPPAPMVAPKDIELREQEPAASTPPDPMTSAKKRKWQQDRVNAALKKIYPPDGNVPASISTALVLRQVIAELGPESRKLGIGDPSWDTVNRARGRA
jgi:hypothetical protein